MPKCSTCGVAEQEVSTKCRPCKAAYDKDRLGKVREKLNRIKLEKGCAKCGYNEHPAALDFNHLDRTTKTFQIGGRTSHAWSKIEKEIAKCEVLCSNCHRIHSYEHQHNQPLPLQ